MTKRTKAIAGLAGVFLLGGICGGLMVGVVVRDRARQADNLRHRDGFIRYFENCLDLTSAQRDSLREELEMSYRELARLRAETSVQYNALLDTFTLRVMPVLTEEQRALYKAQERKFRRFMPNDPRSERRGVVGEQRPSAPLPLHQHSVPSVQAPSGNAGPASPDKLLRKEEKVLPSVPQPADTAASSAVTPSDEAGLMLKMGRRLQLLRGRLNLSDEQFAAMQKVFARAEERTRDIKKEFGDQPTLKHRKCGEMMSDMDQEVLKLLDDNQRESWITLRQEIAHRKRQRGMKYSDPDAGQ